ncbi:hypothetical protein F511_17239 [Dorcoceras hygrometricum]|uniref:CCHC-type domain-containing protein n=1 Tax=Dorcoceras hygrometricum TaxID=472368 RepID=A0A2Z7CTK3_9LAMI|nr:hypothetical protein F511_17239 [Dorcoceras hygrometricum]
MKCRNNWFMMPLFSASGEPVKTSCKKKELKIECRLMNDILAKSVTFKAGSFDAITQERFLLMTAIHFGLKINWSKILFDILKEMVTKSSKQAKGFAAQICILLKGAPDLTLVEAKTFPPLKILTAKTVGTYVAKNKNITAEEETDEPPVEKMVKKAVAKRRPTPAVAELAAKKKRTTVGRAAPTEKSLALVPVATEPPPLLSKYAAAAARLRRKIVPGQFDEENPFVLISSVLLVQADEGVSFMVMDRIGDIYRNLPRRADVIVTTVGARHKCQQGFPGYSAGRGVDPTGGAPGGSPMSYADVVDKAMDIEEGLQNRRSRVRPQVVQGNRPMISGVQPYQSVQSSQPPQQHQVAQQSGHQRFRPRGRQFKKKSGSSSSGSGSSISGSSKVEFCGQCGGRHPTGKCVGVQGSCNVCGQYGHFARVCPLAGSQHTTAPPQG